MKQTGSVCAAVGVTLVLAATGCSSDDGSSDALDSTTANEGGTPGDAGTGGDASGGGTSEGDAGSDSGGSDAADAGDLAIPLPPAADAVTTSESGGATIVQFIVPLDQQQATIGFYDDWTSSQAAEYQRTESESGGVTWLNDPDPGADRNIIALLSPLEGDDFVAVTLTAGVLG